MYHRHNLIFIFLSILQLVTVHQPWSLTIILQNRAKYSLILSRRGRMPSRLKSDNIPQDYISRIIVLLFNKLSTKCFIHLDKVWLGRILKDFGRNLLTYVYCRKFVMYGWQISSARWPYMGIARICWIIICSMRHVMWIVACKWNKYFKKAMAHKHQTRNIFNTFHFHHTCWRL